MDVNGEVKLKIKKKYFFFWGGGWGSGQVRGVRMDGNGKVKLE